MVESKLSYLIIRIMINLDPAAGGRKCGVRESVN